MNNHVRIDFDPLIADEILIEGMLASDVRSLLRRLSRTEAVLTLTRTLASDPDRLRELCTFAERLLVEPHCDDFRHPKEMAICACLVLLRSSPLPEARHLFEQVRRFNKLTIPMAGRLAEYCERNYISSQQTNYASNVRLAHVFDFRAIGLSNASENTLADAGVQYEQYVVPLPC